MDSSTRIRSATITKHISAKTIEDSMSELEPITWGTIRNIRGPSRGEALRKYRAWVEQQKKEDKNSVRRIEAKMWRFKTKYHREYYQKNREKILAQMRERRAKKQSLLGKEK